MAIPAPAQSQLVNSSFEDGATGWLLTAAGDGVIAVVASADAYSGTRCVRHAGSGEFSDGNVTTPQSYPVSPGQRITMSAYVYPIEGTPGTSGATYLIWYDVNGVSISTSWGNNVARNNGPIAWRVSVVSGIAPEGAVSVRPGVSLNTSASSTTSVILTDSLSWDYQYSNSATLNLPSSTQTYSPGATIPFRISASPGPGVTVTSVVYKIDGVSVGEATSAPWGLDAPARPTGTYVATADVYFSDSSVLTTTANSFSVGAGAPTQDLEYNASNSYTYLLAENFSNLEASLPPTAVVTGAEISVSYSLEIIVRSKALGVADPSSSDPFVAFDIANSGTIEVALLSKQSNVYTVTGGAVPASFPLDRNTFISETLGISEGKLVTKFTGPANTVTIGGEDELFSVGSIDASEFTNYALGLRFYPSIGSKPSSADDGDAVYRIKLNSIKLKVYFDAGSVDYYFASPDKTQVLKGVLSGYWINSGQFRTGDASGTLQLTSELELVDGTQTYIGYGWTIHSSYPVLDSNKIGEVDVRKAGDTIGMSYSSLPSYWQVEDNRSRYQFITANFYGDESLDSMFGVNGVDRAFAYNGEFFYNVWTQPDPEKDKPRHVAFHHSHLALGYDQGRVDISVVGEPYNFSGVDGASSWAVGDNVVGLLPLSGAMLGVFGSKSITAISGTTVDNFATQTLSPNIGAVEYTVADMGFPVYANAYGVYTLSQTANYGDYLGNPLSQPISPWLRPRLVRKATSPKEVVVAWPVRSKNQYRLAFADGYVLSMTMNYGNQSAPTFSKQKYFVDTDDTVNDLYSYPSIVPAAVSSELDDGGEERIHIASKLLDGDTIPSSVNIYVLDQFPVWNELEDYEGSIRVTNAVSPASVVWTGGDPLPSGSQLMAANGKITLSIPVENLGDLGDQYSFTGLVTDAEGNTAVFSRVVSIDIPDISITGSLPAWERTLEYSHRLNISNALRDSSVVSVTGTSLPDGWAVTVDNATNQLVVGGPADTDYTLGIATFTITIVDASGRTGTWTGTMNVFSNYVACGAGTAFPGGQQYPSINYVTLGSGTGTVAFQFKTFENPDRFEVWIAGEKVLDTGFWGIPDVVYPPNTKTYQELLDEFFISRGEPTQTINPLTSTQVNDDVWNPGGYEVMTFEKTTTDSVAEVRAYGPLASTIWRFRMDCPS